MYTPNKMPFLSQRVPLFANGMPPLKDDEKVLMNIKHV